MAEYGTSLNALENDWTMGQVLLMLRRITARYERQAEAMKRKPKRERETEAMTETELIKSEFARA